MPSVSAEELSRWMESQYVVLHGDITVRFKDREIETKELLKDVEVQGVRIIYGPLGAGKSTLLRLFAKGVNEMSGKFLGIYVNYDEAVFEVLARNVNPWSRYRLRRIIANALRGIIELSSQGNPGSLINALIELANILYSTIKNWGVEHVLIIHDDLDKFLTSKGLNYNAIISLVGLYANLYEGGPAYERKPWGNKHTTTYLALSDYAAVNASVKYVGKGGLRPLLIWNLPRDAFRELIHEVAPRTGAMDIDWKLLWQLMGGNARSLVELIVNYRWSLNQWFKEKVMVTLRNVLIEERELLNLASTVDVLHEIGDEDHVKPDKLIEDTRLRREPFIRHNIIMETGYHKLSPMPNEPWIGNYHSYQSPAYYWALRTMVNKGTLDVEPTEVIKEVSNT